MGSRQFWPGGVELSEFVKANKMRLKDKSLVYIVRANTRSDSQIFKLGKSSSGAARLGSYVHTHGFVKKGSPQSGARIYFYEIVPARIPGVGGSLLIDRREKALALAVIEAGGKLVVGRGRERYRLTPTQLKNAVASIPAVWKAYNADYHESRQRRQPPREATTKGCKCERVETKKKGERCPTVTCRPQNSYVPAIEPPGMSFSSYGNQIKSAAGYWDVSQPRDVMWKQGRYAVSKFPRQGLAQQRQNLHTQNRLAQADVAAEENNAYGRLLLKEENEKKQQVAPTTKEFLALTKVSYSASPGTKIGSYTLALNTPTVDVWQDDAQMVVVVTIRGTLPTSAQDIRADMYLFGNSLSSTTRYKTDKTMMAQVIARYPSYRIYVAGHSLGGAISMQLRRDFGSAIAGVRGFNSAFQPEDFKNKDMDIQHSYTSSDPLFHLGGKHLANVTVHKTNTDYAHKIGHFSDDLWWCEQALSVIKNPFRKISQSRECISDDLGAT
jgi:hypothetical protein